MPFVLGAAVALAAGVVLAGAATPTQASGCALTTPAEVQAAFAAAATGDTITLCADIENTAHGTSTVAVPANASITLDLNGYDLALYGAADQAGITVPQESSLTVTDANATAPGHLTAVGDAGNAAGIGGSVTQKPGGNVTITGYAQVTATGGEFAAGIGGSGSGGTTGAILISGDARVTATGGDYAAGIGSGDSGTAGSITVSGTAHVTATGGSALGAGIGAGASGSTGDIAISGAAQVTATGGTSAAGIGGSAPLTTVGGIAISGAAQVTATGGASAPGIGSGTDGSTAGAVTIGAGTQVTASSTGGAAPAVGAGIDTGFGIGPGTVGAITVAGTLTVPVGNHMDYPSGAAITESTGTVVNHGTLNTDAGPVANNGAIRTDGAVTTPLNVSVHNTAVTLDGNGASAIPANPPRVYAASFTAGGVPFPSAPSRAGYTFAGWQANGAAVTADTDLGAAGPTTLTLVARWTAASGTRLAESGTDTGPWPWLALGALLAGTALIVLRRRNA